MEGCFCAWQNCAIVKSFLRIFLSEELQYVTHQHGEAVLLLNVLNKYVGINGSLDYGCSFAHLCSLSET